MGAFFPECGNNFGMPQVQLPIFPAGSRTSTQRSPLRKRDGKVYYFYGHLPVFVHEKGALSTFRLFSTQLVINGNATQVEISRAFGVPPVTVKRYVELDREAGAAAFFAPAKKRSASKLTEQVCQQAQELLDHGLQVHEVGRQLGILSNTLHKAIRAGRLRPGKKRSIQRDDSQH
jgi:transposase-like protein